MFNEKTYQDFVNAQNKEKFLTDCVNEYIASNWFRTACAAERYSNGYNDISKRNKSKMVKMTRGTKSGEMIRSGELVDVPMNHISSNIFGRVVDQRVQYLLQNGMNLDNESKTVFGANVDREIERAATYAEIHGESYLFWDMDRAVCYKAASYDGLSGMFFLLDEESGEKVIGIRFYRVSVDKPMTIIAYDPAGFDIYKVSNDGKITLVDSKGYKQRKFKDAFGERTEYEGYDALPFATFKANDDSFSTFSRGIKSKIDAYDVITSDLCDNLERMEGIYWAIKNFGGTSDEAKAMLAELEVLKAAVTQSDTMNDADMEAKPQSIEAPYAAREFASKLLHDAIYSDYMALDLSVLSGGSLTNVAIETAKADLDLACNKLETQVFECIFELLEIIGKTDIYDSIRKYNRQSISNQMERVEMIYSTGMRNDIPRRKALELTGLFEADEIEEIMRDMDSEDVTGIDDAEKLMQKLGELNG